MAPARIGRPQAYALAVVTCLMIVDGVDLVALGLVATGVGEEMRATPAAIGVALSAAQLGSIVSAAAVGRLNERVGTKALLLGVSLLLVLGSIGCALAPDLRWLTLGRVVTGLGLGAALPLAVGYLSTSFAAAVRGKVIAVTLVGLSLGQILAGLIAPPIIAAAGWRAVFVAAAVACAALLPFLICLRGGPARSPASRAQGVTPASTSGRIGHLWRAGWGPQLTALIPAVLGGAMVVYFLLNWLPFLSHRIGLSPAASAGCASLLAAGGLIGVLTWGTLFDRAVPPFAMLAASFLCAAGLLFVISTSGIPAPVFLGACLLLGFFLIGGYNSMTMLIGKVFPEDAHVYIVGMMSAVGRTGGLLAPTAAGMLLSAGRDAYGLFLLTAVLAAAVAGLLAIGARLHRPGL